MTREQTKAFNALTENNWTVEDWADLHRAVQWVTLRVAARHGIITDQFAGEKGFNLKSNLQRACRVCGCTEDNA